MISVILNFISFICLVFSEKTTLLWNINEPYKYNGLIYTDSQVVVVNPAIQIKIINNEEICNFYVNKSINVDETSIPFRAVVKSAHLGLAELILKPNINLELWRNKDIIFFIMAEACHDPDSWSVPALVSIKVHDPPGPSWTKKSYVVNVNNNVPIGTTILKVTAYLPAWTYIENKICQYSIQSPRTSFFDIDGEGTIRTKNKLDKLNSQYLTLVIVAEDCSQPEHRKSKVNVFVSVNPSCKFGWTGFYTLLNYKAGSGIKYLSKNPKFQLCDFIEQEDGFQTIDTTIKDCIGNKTLRLTTSLELKSKTVSSADVDINDPINCKLDFESLQLQREVCGVNDSKAVELLTELNRKKTGVLMFPIQANIFPVISLAIENKFSFYFWMKRERSTDVIEEYIICQIDESGNNIFSVSLRKCTLQVQLKSYNSKYYQYDEQQNVPTMWNFSLPQLCDYKWHHIMILASRAQETPFYAELDLFIDGDMVDYKNDNPKILLNSPLQQISTNITDIFLGQCPKSEKTEFKGLLASVILIPGILLKNSASHCLIKCSERLFFNGMNQMNPGMSVSLNSEMQMIIINGHNINEVVRLIQVIGFVNPNWNPVPKVRELSIETEMSCGKKVFTVPPIKIIIKIEKQSLMVPYKETMTFITLLSTVTTILIPDSTQTNSDMGTGVAVFANTTLQLAGIPQATNSKPSDVLPIIYKCEVKMHPKMSSWEYLDWPRHLLEAVSAEKYSIKVSNTSRIVIFKGLHNQQVYQFVIQHLRYFSTPPDNFLKESTRTFMLQCFSLAGKIIVKSNVAVVKVTIWYNNYQRKDDTTPKPSFNKTTIGNPKMWKNLVDNITVVRNYVPLHAHSNVALISEMVSAPNKSSNVMYNVLLGFGLVALLCVVILFIKKSRRKENSDGYMLPFQVVDRICFPLQIIKEKIKPSPSVRVELSRDFINCTSGRRRDISMEMQWDDTEMKPNQGFNIIDNPMYEKAMDNIDDNIFNKDVPPRCDDEETSTDEDTYEDFTEIYFERNQKNDQMKIK